VAAAADFIISDLRMVLEICGLDGHPQ
jgi:hypothetical protein